MDTEPRKRMRTHSANPREMGVLGSRGLLKESEFIRLILDALISLGLNDTAAYLENESGISLYNHVTTKFLNLVNNGEWIESIKSLPDLDLHNERAVKFLLLEQGFSELLEDGHVDAAQRLLEKEIFPLGVNKQLEDELKSRFFAAGVTAIPRVEFVKKLRKSFPPEVLIPERRLECLLERKLDRDRTNCYLHNVPDCHMSIFSDLHHCGVHKFPSETLQTLEEHTDEVWFLEFSHNGKFLASSSKDKSAIIWEIDSKGKFSRKHTLLGHEKPVLMVLWSPDDTEVITCGEDEAIKRWDVGSGEFLRSYERNGVGSVSCGWFHDGSGIIGGMKDRNILLWKLDGTEIKHELKQREQKLSDVAMTTDGKWLVSMDKEDEITFANRETWEVQKLIREQGTINSFSLSKDSRFILISSNTNDLTLWGFDHEDPEMYHQYEGHTSGSIFRSSFGGDEETFIASGNEDCQVYIWESVEPTIPISKLKGHSGAVNCVSWNPINLHMLASASDDGTIRIWGGRDQKLQMLTDDDDYHDGEDDYDDYELFLCECHNIPNSDLSLSSDHHCGIHQIPSETVQTLEKHTDEVWFLEFSHDGKYLASSSKDKSAIIWEIDAQGKFSEKHKLVGHEKPVVMVLWSPDDKQVATCGENEVIRSWDVESGEFIQSYERNGVGSVSCGWFHDGSGIIAGMTDRSICLWNLDGTKLVHEQGSREQKLSDVAMTTDGKWLVSVDRVHVISLFNRETRAVRLITEEDMITSFSLSKNNKHLLINLITQKIHVWNIEGQPYKCFEYNGHKRSRFIIRSCFGGYEDSFIASGSEDSQVYIWIMRRAQKEPFSVLRGHSGAVNCVSWNPINLHMLASASDDGTIRIWGLDTKLK